MKNELIGLKSTKEGKGSGIGSPKAAFSKIMDPNNFITLWNFGLEIISIFKKLDN
jgi:hypothetical protein